MRRDNSQESVIRLRVKGSITRSGVQPDVDGEGEAGRESWVEGKTVELPRTAAQARQRGYTQANEGRTRP